MRQFATLIGSMFLSMLAFSACDVSADGQYHISWSVDGHTAVADGCSDENAANVDIIVTPVGGGNSLIYTTTCGEGDDITPNLPAGTYDVAISLVDDLGQDIYVHDLGPQDIVGAAVTDLGNFAFSFGTLSTSWDFDMPAGVASTCAQVGATNVVVTAERTDASMISTSFDCTDLQGSLDLVPEGSYTVEYQVLNGSVDITPTAAPVTQMATISGAGNVDTDLEVITF